MKNYERKKQKVRALPDLSIPLQLAVSLPHAVYLPSSVASASIHLSRLRSTYIAKISEMQLTSPPLMLCKMQRPPPHSIPTSLFTIAFDEECTWTVMVQGNHVSVASCRRLVEFEPSLRSVDGVLGLLLSLDQSKFCIGNDNVSLMELYSSPQQRSF